MSMGPLTCRPEVSGLLLVMVPTTKALFRGTVSGNHGQLSNSYSLGAVPSRKPI